MQATISRMSPKGKSHYLHNIMIGSFDVDEVETAPSLPSLLQKSSWEIAVRSPKTGVEKTFKKYFSKKQEIVIVGETTEGSWVTLWKEDLNGKIVWDARSPVAKWLQGCVSSPVLPEGLSFVKECHCRFCSKDLTHPASQFAGYGPICAGKYGLPWGQEA